MIYSLSSWLVLVALGLALGCLWRFWRPLGFLFAALGPLGDPIGSLGGPSGVLGGLSGTPRGSLGGPLGRLGVHRAIFLDLSKIGRPIPSKCVHFTMPAHRI